MLERWQAHLQMLETCALHRQDRRCKQTKHVVEDGWRLAVPIAGEQTVCREK